MDVVTLGAALSGAKKYTDEAIAGGGGGGYTKAEIDAKLLPLENTEEWLFVLEDSSTVTKNVRVAE